MVPILRPAHHFALRLAGNEMDADDLLQEAAIRACRFFHQFRPGTNFRAWFFTILANCFYKQEAKARRRGPQLSLDDAPTLHLYMKTDAARSAPEENPAQAFVSRFDGEQIGQALSELPERFRAVALLYFLEDLHYTEIARVLDIPVGTVRSRLHRSRRILQKLLWDLASEQGLVAAQSGAGLE